MDMRKASGYLTEEDTLDWAENQKQPVSFVTWIKRNFLNILTVGIILAGFTSIALSIAC